MDSKIDFVITWVDGNDKKWLAEKEKYLENNIEFDISNCRYRDWDMLKYWFRSIERYAPWVHKIYFVTAGHYPNWLNLHHPKVQLIRHSDILPKQVLPTFNSNAIEMGIENIPGLSEQFVYFNDDMFISDYVEQKDFFHNNLPCDSAILSTIIPRESNGFYKALSNTVYVLNEKFNIHFCMKNNWKKWYTLKYGKNMLRNIIFSKSNGFPGFYNSHIPNSYLKSIYSEAIHYDPKMCENTITSRFRNNDKNVKSNFLYIDYWYSSIYY